jgi:hypothetical protein
MTATILPINGNIVSPQIPAIKLTIAMLLLGGE